MVRDIEVLEASRKTYEIENKLLEGKEFDKVELPQISGKKLISTRHTPNGMPAVAD